MGTPFDAFDPGGSFDNLFGKGNPYFSQGGKMPEKKAEKGLPWEAKVIDGRYYVPLSQVAQLLKQNGVLPAVQKGLENRIQQLADFNAKKKA